MYAATAPYAVRKLLNPQTPGGRELLRAAFLSADGRRALRRALSPSALTPLLRGMLQALNPVRRARQLLQFAVGRVRKRRTSPRAPDLQVQRG